MKRMIGLFMAVMLVMTVVAGCSDDAVKGDVVVVDETTAEDSTSESTDDTGKMEIDEQIVEDGDLVAANELTVLYGNDFEADMEGWTARGSATAELSTSQAASGSGSMYVSGRSENWEWAEYAAVSKLEPNKTYTFSAKVFFEGDAGTKKIIKLTAQKTADGTQGWDTIAEAEVNAGEWTELTGKYNLITSGSVTEYTPYVEANDAALNFFVDDFEILTEGSGSGQENTVGWEGMVSDFEDDQHVWLPRMGSETLTLSDTSHTGSKSIEVSSRGESYEGIKIPLLGKMVANESYDIEAWVYQASGSAEEIVMTMEKNEGSPTYTRMGGAQTESGNWHKITASYTLVENGTVTELSLYFEAANAELVFNLDDVSIKPKAPVAVKEVQMELQSIHEVYSEHFSVGVAIGDNFLKDSRMKDLIGLHFNSITAENSMKPEPMLDNSSRGHINFLMADQYNAYAKKIDAGLRGHALVWHNQTPGWFFKEDYSDDGALVSREVMLKRMEEYIEKVIKRYDASTLYAWDVVNEAIDPSEDDNMRRSLWYEVVGPDFVEKAFEYARKHTEGSDVKLYYNDYSVVSDINKRMAIYDLCMDLKAKGLIDGVGLQSHISIFGPGPKAFEDTIRLFGDAGLDVQITELDISIYENDSQTYTEVPDELLIRQAYRYKELFEVFVDNSDVVSNVTVWGLLDTQSWLNYFPVTRKNWPLFFDGEYQAKYAYYGVTDPSLLPEDVKLVELRDPAYETKAVQGTPVIDGIMDGSWDMADSLQVNHYILGETGATAVAKTMYDKDYLYVMVEVSDDTPGTSSENPWEQDSVEVFMDEDMGRTSEYGLDDGQYRVSRDNTVTVNGPVEADEVISAVTETSDGYMVEIAIPFQSGAKSPGEQIGFDIQVNDDQGGGKRDSFTKWNDVTDNGWKSTEGFGTLTFK